MGKSNKKVILYARFSPRPGQKTSESDQAQITLMETHAFQKRWDVEGVYRDRGISGSSVDRPGLWAAIDALRPGYVLLVTKLDRLARDVYLSLCIERAVEKKRARIVSLRGEGTEGTTPEDRLVRSIMQAFDEFQRKVMASRTSAAMRAHQANGRKISSQAPYGYTVDPDDSKRIVPLEREQRAITRILVLHSEGKSNRAIARAMDVERMPCRGASWNHQQVKSILRRSGVTASD